MGASDRHSASFIASAQASGNLFHSLDDTRRWLRALQENAGNKVERIELDAMDQWYTEEETGNLRHRSGRFFSITGLDCRPRDAQAFPWQQPIIDQPEVGILGILSKEFDGVRYFLMQAKMEPGNINKVQISPTLQATHSNYTQAHKGRLPPYMAYFLDGGAPVISSQLQSETGTRFLRKYNRNVLLDVTAEVEVLPGFRWLTLHELQCLMAMDNTVNMDSRSVLANISYRSPAHAGDPSTPPLLRSASGMPGDDGGRLAELRDWLAAMRRSFAIDATPIPLTSVRDWVRDDWGIRHVSRNHFTVAAVRVEAADREVARWCQPLLLHEGLGLAGFLCADIDGVTHFLMQAKPEPGIAGSVEIGPTVSVFDYRARADAVAAIPFIEYFLQPRDTEVLHSSIQSEEGGRFWNLCNRVLVLKVPDSAAVPVTERYRWMTLAQLQRLSQGESVVNSEARTLLSCLQFFDGSR